MIAAGVLGTIAGILAIAYPDITLLALALIAGINLMLLGVMSLVDAFSGDGTRRRACSPRCSACSASSAASW